MTCGECGDLMLEVARRRAAPFVERAVAAHTAGCGECARRLDRERSVTAGLRALAAADAVLPVTDLEDRLAAAFAAAQGAPARPATIRAARGWLQAAAGLALATGLVAWWTVGSARIVRPEPGAGPAAARTSTGPRAGAVQAPEPRVAAADHPGTGSHTARPGPTAGRTRRTTGAAPRAVGPQPVQPAGFTPIPAAAGLPDFESGEIVRLGIAVTALPNYGIEMPIGAQSAVQADLLIGQDGQARAIRLVVTTSEDARPWR